MSTVSENPTKRVLWTLADEVEAQFVGVIGNFAALGGIRKYSEPTLQRILDQLVDDGLNRRDPKMLIHRLAVIALQGGAESYVNDFMTYASVVDSGMDISFIKSLHLYRVLGLIAPEHDLVQNERSLNLMQTSARLTAIFGPPSKQLTKPSSPFKWVKFYDDDSSGAWLLKDERMAQLIWDRLDEGDRIVDIVRERNAIEWEVICGVLDNPSPAMSVGVL